MIGRRDLDESDVIADAERMGEPVEIAFYVQLHTARIRTLRTLEQWSNLFALEHDRDIATWNDVDQAIALGYLAGGDYADFVAGSYVEWTRR